MPSPTSYPSVKSKRICSHTFEIFFLHISLDSLNHSQIITRSSMLVSILIHWADTSCYFIWGKCPIIPKHSSAVLFLKASCLRPSVLLACSSFPKTILHDQFCINCIENVSPSTYLIGAGSLISSITNWKGSEGSRSLIKTYLAKTPTIHDSTLTISTTTPLSSLPASLTSTSIIPLLIHCSILSSIYKKSSSFSSFIYPWSLPHSLIISSSWVKAPQY